MALVNATSIENTYTRNNIPVVESLIQILPFSLIKQSFKEVSIQLTQLPCEHFYTFESPSWLNYVLNSEDGAYNLGQGICWLASTSVIASGVLGIPVNKMFMDIAHVVRNTSPSQLLHFNKTIEERARLPFLTEAEPNFVDTKGGGLKEMWLQPKYIARTKNFMNALMNANSIPIKFDFNYLQSCYVDTNDPYSIGLKVIERAGILASENKGIILPAMIFDKNTGENIGGHMIGVSGMQHYTDDSVYLAVHDSNFPTIQYMTPLETGLMFQGIGTEYLNSETEGIRFDTRVPSIIVSARS